MVVLQIIGNWKNKHNGLENAVKNKKLDQLMRKLYTTKHGDFIQANRKAKVSAQRLIAMDIRKH